MMLSHNFSSHYLALVNVFFAEWPCESQLTVACEVVDPVQTGGIVLARVRSTLVNVGLAVGA